MDYGLARTVLSSAVADGLAKAGVAFTLPPVQKSSNLDPARAGNLAQKQSWKHIVGASMVPEAHNMATDAEVEEMTKAAAANKVILMS